jgi:uncharacterized protein
MAAVGAAGGIAAAAYMAFEAQWTECRTAELQVPRLPRSWSGLTILHLSDVHAGIFPTNERSLHKAVSWAEPLKPDLMFLTGDVLGDPRHSGECLEILAQIKCPLGKYAVTGNHEYGISKGPLVRTRDTTSLWRQAGITLLRDECVPLPPRQETELLICGADYLTGGYGLDRQREISSSPCAFRILLIHEPPPTHSPLKEHFALTFAGHTHGGQIRIPTKNGLVPFDDNSEPFLSGVHSWGDGTLVVSRGVGTSFVPFRLLTRPEATLWRLV